MIFDDKRIIGGFFSLDLPFVKSNRNFLSLWGINEDNSLFFHNARSCLFYLLQTCNANRLWLPAYICNDIPEAVKDVVETNFYPISSTLTPDIKFLKKHMKSQDFILAVDYFGKNPDDEFIKFTKESQDITWIEDRAQAIYPSNGSWGDYILYSPRKVIGVPDGGIIVTNNSSLPKTKHSNLSSTKFIEAALLRYEDIYETDNINWYGKYCEYEKNMGVSNLPMSNVTRAILESTDPYATMQKRTENYKFLKEKLSGIALFSEENDFVPMGFPIRVQNRENILEYLHKNKIFAPVHWKELPVDGGEFLFEKELSKEIITLPCDHRYEQADLERIVEHFVEEMV